MPCTHKFQNELNLSHLHYQPTTLIVGTFNPSLPAANPAPWFYGTPATPYFWDVLPRLYGKPSLIDATPQDWKQFCQDEKIAITDIVSSINDARLDDPEQHKALAGFSDKPLEYIFEDLDFVNIVQLLRHHPTIQNVYFTRSITDAFWRHLWNPVMQYCNQHHLHEKRLFTPSNGYAYEQKVYNDQNPENQLLLPQDYILMKWQQAWHF